MSPSETPVQLDIRKILDLLPHRYPFLLVDRVTELVPAVSVKAYKCVSFNEPFFQGHFPGHDLRLFLHFLHRHAAHLQGVLR